MKIIVVGGGFGGVEAAQRLRRELSPAGAEIVLFDRENHMAFHPLLAEVAGASINPDAAAVPLRQMLPAVDFRSEAVVNVDFAHKTVDYLDDAGTTRQMPYDHVLLAAGRVV